MDVLNPVYTEKTTCQDCYKCLRQCSVKAIHVENGHARILGDQCTVCGTCVTVCPVGAKKVRDDFARIKPLLQEVPEVFVIVAPSWVSDYPGLRAGQLISAIKRAGFSGVAEASLGADLVSMWTGHHIDSARQRSKLFISTACPTVVSYLCKYRQELVDSLVPIASPLKIAAQLLRKRFGTESAIVFFGPCISKKIESDTDRSLIHSALGFTDLDRLFQEKGIDPWSMQDDSEGFILGKSGRGILYPIDGGMIASVKRSVSFLPLHAMSFSGMEHVRRALDGLDAQKLSEPVFLELLACEGGCINGPMTRNKEGTIRKRLNVLAQSVKSGTAARDSEPPSNESWTRGQTMIRLHGDAEVREALRRVGKTRNDEELNCSACGYDSCRDFALALLDGKSETTMCVSYMRKLAHKKANALLRTMPSGVVLADRELKVIECNRVFAALMGDEVEGLFDAKPGLAGLDLGKVFPEPALLRTILEQETELEERDLVVGKRILHASVFNIEAGSIVGAIVQDITNPKVQRDRIVTQARSVIEKNLQVVQQIAYLLGENAAESEGILNSIIKSFGDDEDAS